MMRKIFFSLLVAIYTYPQQCASSSVHNVFLRQVHRFNDSQYTDYYFGCNVVGQFLAWQFNSDSLAGFLPNNIGRAVVNSRSGFRFTTTLLSSRAITNESRFELDSILVVSFDNTLEPLPFMITCRNEGESNDATFTGDDFDVTNSQTSEGVTLDYVLSGDIVQGSKTHIFVCGTGFEFQFLQVTGPTIGFSQSDRIGVVKKVLSVDRRTANILGILMDEQPFNSTTLLVVVTNSVVNVRCFYDSNHEVMLSLNQISTQSQSRPVSTQVYSPETTTYGTKKSSTDFHSTTISIGDPDGFRHTTTIIVTGLVVGIFLLLVTLLLMPFVTFFIYRKFGSRYTMKDNFSRTFSNKCDLNITYCGQMCEINDESKQEDEQKNTKMIKGETSVQHIPDKDKEDGMVDTRKTDRNTGHPASYDNLNSADQTVSPKTETAGDSENEKENEDGSEYGHQVKDVSHLSEMVAGGFSQVIFVGEKKQSIYSGRSQKENACGAINWRLRKMTESRENLCRGF